MMMFANLQKKITIGIGFVVVSTALLWGLTGTLAAGDEVAIRPVSWRLSSVDGPRVVDLRNSVGYCVGDPKPRVDHVKVIEHPKSIFITTYVGFPAPPQTSGQCAGVRLILKKRLRLKLAIEGRTIFDGSKVPPSQRWP
jgi:hypothetical protein